MTMPSVEIHLSISPEPYFHTMLQYFLASFRRHAGACVENTRFVVTVGSENPPLDMAAALPWSKEYPIEWRWIDRDLFRKYSWHAQAVDIFRHAFAADIVVRMDPDILIAGPLDDIVREAHATGCFTGLIAHVSPFAGKSERPNRECWEMVYREAELPLPPFDHQHSMWPRMVADPAYRYCPPYFNGGVLFAPAAVMAAIGSTIFQEMDAVDRLFDTFYKGQLAISLAIQRHHIPCREMDWKYNFPCTKPAEMLGPIPPEELDDMRVWHYMGDGVISKQADFAGPAAVEQLLERTGLSEAMTVFQHKLRIVHDEIRREHPEPGRGKGKKTSHVVLTNRPVYRKVEAQTFSPVFLLGVMRSGTTLLAKLLDRFPGIVYCPFELKQIWSTAGGVPMASPRTTDLECPPAGAADMRPGQAEALRRAFLGEMEKRAAEKSHGGIFLNKNPHLCNKLPLVDALFPEARYLWIHRPLPQMAASQVRLFSRVNADHGTWEYWPPERTVSRGQARCWEVARQSEPPVSWERDRVFPGGDIRWICEYWLESNQAVANFLRALPADRWLEIAENDLLADPGRELARCLGLLGLPRILPADLAAEIDRTKTTEWKQMLSLDEAEGIRLFLQEKSAEVQAVFAREEYQQMENPVPSTTAAPDPRAPVCVAGMHRSGTSMITRLLNQCGMALGPAEDIASANVDNREGFWENRRFVEINDALLDAVGGGWDLVPSLPAGWESASARPGEAARARELIRSFSGEPFWGWKDPRSTILLKFWKRIAPALRVVVCLRNPLEVARSLRQRNNFSLAAGFHLWKSYMDRLLADTAPGERIVTSYEAYFQDAEGELRRVLRGLGREAPESVIREACASVKPDARHGAAGLDELSTSGAPADVIALYRSLLAEADVQPAPAAVPIPAAPVCNICGSAAGFDLTNPDNPRESWVCRGCGSTSRDRMYILGLARALGRGGALATWPAEPEVRVLESAGARAHPRLLVGLYTYWNTHFVPEELAKPAVDKTRYADLQALHYDDASFDVVMNSDVFEHVRLHRQALGEIFRVLKPGGVLVLQAPFNPRAEKNLIRVRPEGETDVMLEPAMYHAEDTLVYRLYGAELLDELRAAGFQPDVVEGEYPEHRITPQSLVLARKPGSSAPDFAAMAGGREGDAGSIASLLTAGEWESLAARISARLQGREVAQSDLEQAAVRLHERLTTRNPLHGLTSAENPVSELELALLDINAERADEVGRSDLGAAFRRTAEMIRRMRPGGTGPAEEAASDPEGWRQLVADADRAAGEGRMEDAAGILARAALRYPQSPEVLSLLATVLSHLRRYREAADALRRAVTFAPDDARLFNMLGTLMAVDGNLQAAAAAYVRAVQLDPGFEEARANLDTVEAKLRGDTLPVKKSSTTRPVRVAPERIYPPGQCPICESRNLTVFQDVQGYRYHACADCEALFIDPDYLERVERGENLVRYAEDYWNFQMPLSRERAFSIALARMAEVVHYARIPIRKFLDIGGGPGYFLDAVATHLPSHAGAFYSTDKFPPPEPFRTKRPNYVVGDLGDLTDRFDAGICIEVLEHLTPRTVRDLFEKLARISNPQAIYLFNTGMPAHVRYEMPGYLEPLQNGHIVSYSLKAIARLAEPFGFRAFPLAGKTWAFVLEYQSAGKPDENLKDRIWSSPPENMKLLEDPQTGGVIRILGLESARAYG